MGDGINKAMEILICILNLPNGTLLIDEIENGFHYSLYEKLTKIFCETALKMNCQIIMTTHNRDIIEAVMNSMTELNDLNGLCYQRLAILKSGKRKAFTFQGEELKDSFDANMEIR